MYGLNLNQPKLNEIVKMVESIEDNSEGYSTVRIAFLRNVTIDPTDAYLKYLCALEKWKADVYMGEYDAIIQDVLNRDSELFRFKPEVIVLCLKLDYFSSELTSCYTAMSEGHVAQEKDRVLDFINTVIQGIRKNSNATILVHNFEVPVFPGYGIYDSQNMKNQRGTFFDINVKLQELVQQQGNVYLIDVDRIQTVLGYENYLDRRYWHIGKAPYTRAAAMEIAREYMKALRALKGRAKKCLVLDCDNTLWGGIVSEDGPDNIQIGKTYPGSAFLEFQKSILNLFHRGVMLTVCSKNNPKDVMDVLENHPDMVLRKENFVSIKVNWNDKPSNIIEISKELNIGLDSIVFIDDSEFEINSVKQIVPDVLSIHLQGDPVLYADFLNSCGLFDTLTVSEEDRKRNQMYLSEESRKRAASSMQNMTLEEYYRYLEMEVEIKKADSYSVPRIAQLSQRTNQFNLTTKRYSEADILYFVNSETHSVRYIKVWDRFGDSGIVGAAILNYKGEDCYIDTFLLSCRVIGRGVEDVLLKACETLALKKGCSRIIGLYIPSQKNMITSQFYEQHGFELTDESVNGKEFSFLLGSSLKIPDYFKNVYFCD